MPVVRPRTLASCSCPRVVNHAVTSAHATPTSRRLSFPIQPARTSALGTGAQSLFLRRLRCAVHVHLTSRRPNCQDRAFSSAQPCFAFSRISIFTTARVRTAHDGMSMWCVLLTRGSGRVKSATGQLLSSTLHTAIYYLSLALGIYTRGFWSCFIIPERTFTTSCDLTRTHAGGHSSSRIRFQNATSPARELAPLVICLLARLEFEQVMLRNRGAVAEM